jgi:hypothetical protein
MVRDQSKPEFRRPEIKEEPDKKHIDTNRQSKPLSPIFDDYIKGCGSIQGLPLQRLHEAQV